MPAETTAVEFSDEQRDRLVDAAEKLDNVDLVEMLLNVFVHAHVLAEHDHHAGLHNTIYCGESAFAAIAGRCLPEEVVTAAVDQFKCDV